MSRLRPSALHLTIRNELSEIGRIVPLIEGFCADEGFPEEIAHAINLSLDELLTNTISYGYDDAAQHRIDIDIAATGDSVSVALRDDARPFDPTEAAAPDLDAGIDERALGGLGIHLVRVMMDEMRYRRVDGHNQLTLIKRSAA